MSGGDDQELLRHHGDVDAAPGLVDFAVNVRLDRPPAWLRDRLAAGATPEWASLGVAAWMAYVAAGRDRLGRELPLDDPLADRLRSAVGTGSDPVAVATGLLGVREVFADDLRDSAVFRDALVRHLKELL